MRCATWGPPLLQGLAVCCGCLAQSSDSPLWCGDWRIRRGSCSVWPGGCAWQLRLCEPPWGICRQKPAGLELLVGKKGAFRTRGTKSLSYLGGSRAQARAGIGRFRRQTWESCLFPEKCIAFKLARRGASGMCGLGFVIFCGFGLSPTQFAILCHFALCPLLVSSPWLCLSSLRTFAHA